jgi:hypothetical protein
MAGLPSLRQERGSFFTATLAVPAPPRHLAALPACLAPPALFCTTAIGETAGAIAASSLTDAWVATCGGAERSRRRACGRPACVRCYRRLLVSDFFTFSTPPACLPTTRRRHLLRRRLWRTRRGDSSGDALSLCAGATILTFHLAFRKGRGGRPPEYLNGAASTAGHRFQPAARRRATLKRLAVFGIARRELPGGRHSRWRGRRGAARACTAYLLRCWRLCARRCGCVYRHPQRLYAASIPLLIYVRGGRFLLGSAISWRAWGAGCSMQGGREALLRASAGRQHLRGVLCGVRMPPVPGAFTCSPAPGDAWTWRRSRTG